MQSIQTTQFNWLPRQPAWQEIQNWREKHQAYQADADATFASAAGIFSDAAVNLGAGLSNIAAQRASSRLSAAINVKQQASLDTLA
jgi:hypothetical protein